MEQADQPSNIVSFPGARAAGGHRAQVEMAFQTPAGKVWVLVDRATWERLLNAARQLDAVEVES